jgi:hypothetical protein
MRKGASVGAWTQRTIELVDTGSSAAEFWAESCTGRHPGTELAFHVAVFVILRDPLKNHRDGRLEENTRKSIALVMPEADGPRDTMRRLSSRASYCAPLGMDGLRRLVDHQHIGRPERIGTVTMIDRRAVGWGVPGGGERPPRREGGNKELHSFTSDPAAPWIE